MRCAATDDITPSGDPFESVFDHYYTSEPSPRVFPVELTDTWFKEKSRGADGVVFYLPPDDDTLGWDYPRQRRHLDELGVPHLLVRSDAADFGKSPAKNMAESARSAIAEFVRRLREGKHGG